MSDKMNVLKTDFGDSSRSFLEYPFYFNGSSVENGPVWGMSVLKAGSMRFRWNESNPNRDRVLGEIAGSKNVESIELIHSKTVFVAKNPGDCTGKCGDGIVCQNKNIMPVVTVADCMPLYLFDKDTGAFGVVHSGWKGTGIVSNAVSLMAKEFGSAPKNICVAIGAHIHDCCYVVDSERASYFSSNFGESCVTSVKEGEILCKGAASVVNSWNNGNGSLFRLSLLQANLWVLKNCGIQEENIVLLDECTCCNPLFGSNRRETAGGTNFTVQLAFVRW